MNNETRKLFETVAKKMGWTDTGLDVAKEKLIKEIGKSRRPGISGDGCAKSSLSEREDDSDLEKENLQLNVKKYRSKTVIDSSDDDFNEFLVEKATPKSTISFKKPLNSATKVSISVVSSDSDGGFETFLQRVKTPNVKPKKVEESGSEDSLKKFIVDDDDSSDDDFIEIKSSSRVPKKNHNPTPRRPLRPLSQCDSPVFVSDSSDDDIVVKSTWRTRHSRPQPPSKVNKKNPSLCNQEEDSPQLPLLSSPSICASQIAAIYSNNPKRTLSAPSKLEESDSSEEELSSLLERLKKKNKFPVSTSSPITIKENSKEPSVSLHPFKVPPTKGSKLLVQTPKDTKTPGKSTVHRPIVSQTEPRHGPSSRIALCKTPGCFLESLSNPHSTYVHNFKKTREELTSKLYRLYNTSVFDSKLPIDMSVKWNKKMRKTAGYCITGQERGGGSRYARIELSEKVCDSADRLRDTLIHEMCHAATWLINGVRDGHGNFWKLYARKSTLVHPELPMVTRCHSYDIKYKFQYQCVRCQNTIGRHSKSLDTQRFACALCTGQLVLLTPSKPRTVTPFANFIKENYGTVRQELAGQSHAEVMRKLSADFASKTKLNQS